MTMYEFSQQIFSFKKSKKFDEALAFFKANKYHFTEEEIGGNSYLVDAILSGLRKTGKAKLADVFLKQYHIIISESTAEQILNAYGWTVYDNIKNETITKQYIVGKTNELIHLLLMKDSIYSYAVVSNIFRIGLNIAKEHQNQDYYFTNAFCDIFDVNALTLETHVFEVGGKKVEQASDKEKWYSEKSKALYELGQFQKCYEVSEESLYAIDTFHNNSDLWFARRIALSQKQLGNIDEAIEQLQNVYKRKREWFIQKEIADLYFEKGELEFAFKNCAKALNARGKIEFKIGLIFLMGKILKAKEENILAQKHCLLVKKIREDHSWKILEEIQSEIDNTIQDNITTKELTLELYNYWKSLIPKAEFQKGSIKKILNDNEKGKNGFIAAENQDYYFTLSKHIWFMNKVKEGVKVKFEVMRLPDGKMKAKIVGVL